MRIAVFISLALDTSDTLEPIQEQAEDEAGYPRNGPKEHNYCCAGIPIKNILTRKQLLANAKDQNRHNSTYQRR